MCSRRAAAGAPFFAQRRVGDGRFLLGAPVSKRTRPGTVLVMVVAMLSMLFMVGAVLLSNVAFESSSIAGERKAKRRSAVVDRLLREASAALKKSFLGNDGKPFNRDSEAGEGPSSPIGNDTYGELPGVHPLLASIEPHDPDGNGTFYFYGASDLELTLAIPPRPLNRAVQTDGNPDNDQPGMNLVHVNVALSDDTGNLLFPMIAFDSGNWDEINEGQTFLNINVSPNGELELYRRDADGDGVWDSYEYRLPDSRYPSSIRGDLAEQLVADDFDPAVQSTDPEDMFYALRVIPHGAMVDVGHAHMTLLENLLGAEADAFTLIQSFVPEGEEPLLRRRFLMPPRDLPLSTLQARPPTGLIPSALYFSFVDEYDNFTADAEDPRWWPIDTGIDGEDPDANIENQWLPWMDPATGDSRHLLTTASHDDNLMRIGRDNGFPLDWIEVIVFSAPLQFSIDDWPIEDEPAHPLNGRIKVSLPGLLKTVIDAHNDATKGSMDDDNLDGLLELLPGNEFYDRFVRTIQDAFILMLRNITDLNTLASLDISKTAAALTANLIDFADADGDPDAAGVPTRVEIRDVLTGVGTGEYVYGLEAQPYITEIFADPENDNFAVELFNPYAQSIDLTKYELIDADNVPVSPLNAPLSGTLAAGDYVVFTSGDGNGFPNGTPLPGAWTLETNANVGLWLTDGIPAPDNEILVDQFKSNDALGQAGSLSNQRFTGVTNATGGWTALVPKPIPSNTDTLNSGSGGDTTTGDPGVRPVQIDFDNQGNIADAFPTTGSLLLLCRYANNADAPFTASLKADSDRIDNGRMPLFVDSDGDPANDGYAQAPNANPFGLGIPWGQLVFDYFTALPLNHQYDPEPNANDFLPTVDLTGLRVHGRIDINAAPWAVMAGLPFAPMEKIPALFRVKIKETVYPDTSPPDAESGSIGETLAQSIVAYREARMIGNSADFATARFREAAPGEVFTGFLTVGELANVRSTVGNASSDRALYDIDSGVIDIDGSAPENEDFVKAAAVLIALGDWVTTRSHVFTVYGTLRGAGGKSAVDQNAIRFQETVDRLPSFYNNKLPRRIGPRTVGPYTQASHD